MDREKCVREMSFVRPGDDKELRMHDGLMGLAFMSCSVWALSTASMLPIMISGMFGALQVSSLFTGYCPLHHFLMGRVV